MRYILLVSMLLVNSAYASHFGFGDTWKNGIWRTEYKSKDVGSVKEPFVKVVTDANGTNTTYHVYDHVYPSTNNTTWDAERDTLIVDPNNDIGPENRCMNGGAPNTALPVKTSLGAGTYGVTVSGTTNKVYTLEINHEYSNPCWGGIPWLGLGNFTGNGTKTPIGFINSTSGNITSLKLKLEKFYPGIPVGNQPVSGKIYIMMVAEWNNNKHMLIINMFSDGFTSNGGTFDWKWPYPQSSYYPGARVGFFEANMVGIPYLRDGVEQTVTVDWDKLFKKADSMGMWGNDHIPLGVKIALTRFEVAGEITGEGEIPFNVIESNMNKTQYLIDNPDVANANMDAWVHYSQWGKYEGRRFTPMDSSPIESKSTFDSEWYLRLNPDVEAVGG